MRVLSIALLCFGGLLHLGLLIPTLSSGLDWFLLAFLCWILFPYVLAGYVASQTRPKLIFQAVVFVICLLVAFIGTSMTYSILYLDNPDAQSAIGLFLMPFYQLIVLAPLIEIGMICKVFYLE